MSLNRAESIDDYKRVIKLIAAQFGPNTEVVLHDFTNGFDSTIIAIENNHVTGRNIGGCGTNLGIDILNNNGRAEDKYGYITKLANGKTLRSSTLFLYDDNNRMWGSICINTDISNTIRLANEFNYLTSGLNGTSPNEIFVHNVSELIDHYIAEYENMYPRNENTMSKTDKLEAIRFFDSKGVFLISKAGSKLCKYLRISKGTLYSYLETVRQPAELISENGETTIL